MKSCDNRGMSWKLAAARLSWLACLALFASIAMGCPSGDQPTILPIERSVARVNETLIIDIQVANPGSLPIRYRFEPTRSIPAIDSVTTINGSTSSGELRWTPLTSHVGLHELTITIASPSGQVYDTETAIVEVMPSSDAAPVFIEPGAGGTYDLARDPCVRFRVEIRDDDSPTVGIQGRVGALPAGATVTSDGAKSAAFEWCPTSDQIAASSRWTIGLEADDTDHPAVPHDYVVVLRGGGGSNCMGAPPVIEVLSPAGGDRVTSGAGYEVRARVTDDVGLRDAPILYWTTETPSDPSRPDVTLFEQALFEQATGDEFVARVPSLGLAVGEEREVFIVLSATDNDDAAGTLCDQNSDTALGSFFAVGGMGGSLSACDSCSASIECTSGVCAPSSGGAVCLDACTGTCAGGLTCSSVTTSEGSRTMACTGADGSVSLACTTACVNDPNEPNNTSAQATTLRTGFAGQICSGDHDIYAIPAATRGAQVEVTLSGFRSMNGDLDLRLTNAAGAILGSSAGVTDMERVTYCAPNGDPLYADVFGFDGAQNPYDIALVVRPAGCCINDANEPDDSALTGRLVTGTDFDGTLCADDNDYRTFNVAAPSTVRVQVIPAADAIVDIELFDAAGMMIAASMDVGGVPTISRLLSPGRYAVRVYGYMSAGDAYLGEIVLTPAGTTCTTTRDCGAGQVCATGMCRSDDCTSAAMCPAMHLCPDPGPSTAASDCGLSCLVNADCRSSEACKWFAEGRACGLRGTGALGAACSSFRDCGVQRSCVDWPGGYCTRARCARSSDCETGSFCVTASSATACAIDCAADSTRCRAGYTCRTITDIGGAMRSVCVP
jgi:hypothetical protein